MEVGHFPLQVLAGLDFYHHAKERSKVSKSLGLHPYLDGLAFYPYVVNAHSVYGILLEHVLGWERCFYWLPLY